MSIDDRDKARNVFVVHGRNRSARDAMFAFLRALGLRPIEWSEAIQMTGEASPYIGQVLDVALKAAQGIVVLLTPDEIAYLRHEYADGPEDADTTPTAQARPNVLFEAGMAMGRDATRTVLVEMGKLRSFTDVAGRHSVRMTNDAATRKDLAQRLANAGCAVNMTGVDWLSEGDFTAPPDPGDGLVLGKRVPGRKPGRAVRVDVRYHERSGGSGRLEVMNLGQEDLFEVDLELPAFADEERGSLQLMMSGALPVPKLPPGKTVTVPCYSMRLDYCTVTVTAQTVDKQSVREEVFVSLR